MEKLSHIITQKLLEGVWKPVKVSRGGPDISHLFFADDLIRFGQASLRQAEVMRECLDSFSDLSGQEQQRLATWKSATLSLAGRITLIKSVASAIPVYAMQSVKLPIEVCNKLDKLNREFLWGHSVDQRKIHLINWETTCLPKSK
ncbi:hypothetical protein Dsin_024750 [Dipteronia sinensis]|uniref:Reverse transcriptase n=1 Tax=Dipteronia sinensis TaxID=43782 RepID=A0AAE0DW67_9ROSI|nr:hypothetical protein Dsin_024750 [Dipteronia sinensis]